MNFPTYLFVCSVQNSVRGARKSPLTDFSLRMGPLLVRLTLEKLAMSRLTIISFNITMLITYQNETWFVNGNIHILSQSETSVH